MWAALKLWRRQGDAVSPTASREHLRQPILDSLPRNSKRIYFCCLKPLACGGYSRNRKLVLQSRWNLIPWEGKVEGSAQCVWAWRNPSKTTPLQHSVYICNKVIISTLWTGLKGHPRLILSRSSLLLPKDKYSMIPRTREIDRIEWELPGACGKQKWAVDWGI